MAAMLAPILALPARRVNRLPEDGVGMKDIKGERDHSFFSSLSSFGSARSTVM
jgi:hypothetical protein